MIFRVSRHRVVVGRVLPDNVERWCDEALPRRWRAAHLLAPDTPLVILHFRTEQDMVLFRLRWSEELACKTSWTDT